MRFVSPPSQGFSNAAGFPSSAETSALVIRPQRLRQALIALTTSLSSANGIFVIYSTRTNRDFHPLDRQLASPQWRSSLTMIVSGFRERTISEHGRASPWRTTALCDRMSGQVVEQAHPFAPNPNG